ncbi:MAG: YfhO family protein, partial [Ruminococcus sp.]|nr:YfhO family protein [Ruminococcus sp.]
MAKSTAVSKTPSYAVAYEPKQYVKFKPLYYLAAFLIPALLTFIAYAIFGVYPFGERSVLTLDLNGQYVYYFENIRRAFWNGESLLYSWARNLSGGYQGVIGYYLASPFTFIVVLMPRSLIVEALMIMQLCKVGACGVTMFAYVENAKRVKPFQSIIFSTMYALMAFVAIQLIDPMWVDGPIFLPLVILGVEYLVDDGRKIN